jgi:hypothetical protein
MCDLITKDSAEAITYNDPVMNQGETEKGFKDLI